MSLTTEAAPQRWPGARTRPVALLGDPVEHSLSPRLHNTVFRALDLDLVYVALRVAAEDVGTVLDALGAVGAAGANVTVPHKLLVHDLCQHRTPEATLLGAVNTVWWRSDGLHGTNTDATGLARVLLDTVDALRGAPAVVLGTGGAARAAVVAATRAGAIPTVVGRRDAPLREVVAVGRAAGADECVGVLLEAEDTVAREVAGAHLVINATPLGMQGEDLPPAFHALRPGQHAHDLVYGTERPTPFLRDAAAAGARTHDGTAMLAAQAEDAFEAWLGEPAPAGAYQAAMPQPS